MFCPQCGEEIPGDSVFCPLCGAKAGPADNPMPPSKSVTPGQPQVPPGPPPDRAQRLPPAVIFGGIVVVVIVILIGLVVLSPQVFSGLSSGKATVPPTPGGGLPGRSSTSTPTLTPIKTPTPSPTSTGSTSGSSSNGGMVVFTGRAPDADFTATTLIGAAPLTVRFTDRSTGSPIAWVWDFGDGERSTDQDPIHTFSKPGTYTVTLKAISNGGSGSERKADYIQVSSGSAVTVAITSPAIVPPGDRSLEPDWSIDPVSGPAPLTVHFTDLSVGTPTSWHWTFGDGSSSDQQNPVHTYTAPGTYAVTYAVGTMWDGYGMGQIGTVTVTAPATSG